MKSIVDQLDAEITALQAKLSSLMAAKRALTSGTHVLPPPKPAKVARIARKRAKKGQLEAAILQALQGVEAPGLSNKEVRSKIQASGYPFSLSALHVLKTLNRLNALQCDRTGGVNRYSIKTL